MFFIFAVVLVLALSVVGQAAHGYRAEQSTVLLGLRAVMSFGARSVGPAEQLR